MRTVIQEAAQRLRYAGDHFHDAGLNDRAEAEWAAADALLAIVGAMPGSGNQPKQKAAWALCRHESCGHRWVVVYLPMDLIKAATAMKRATCPMCGDTRPLAFGPPADGGDHG